MRHKLIILLAGIAGLAGLVLAPAAGGAAAKDKGGNAPVQVAAGSSTSDLISPATLTADSTSDNAAPTAGPDKPGPKPIKCNKGNPNGKKYVQCPSQAGDTGPRCDKLGAKYNRDLARANNDPDNSKRQMHDQQRAERDRGELFKKGCQTPSAGQPYTG
jgi:hypothetical protein